MAGTAEKVRINQVDRNPFDLLETRRPNKDANPKLQPLNLAPTSYDVRNMPTLGQIQISDFDFL